MAKPQSEPELPGKLPRHVAIIMDGNGRWAKRRGLPRSAGHAAGTEALRDIIRACDDWGIEALTIYAFSTENWARPEDEVGALMGLLLKYFASEIDELHEKNVRIRIIGDIAGLPGAQREAVLKAMRRTEANTGLNLSIALNYGGRQEILRAALALMRENPGERDAVSAEEFERHLYTHGLPDVDLMIRTSGEQRISNFLLWQGAYAELVFADEYWPDYTRELLRRDLWMYAKRDRRFGQIKEKQ